MSAIDVLGDATRGGEWSVARLRVDGCRILDADVDGLDRPLAGLTLLEAAAVGGEPLAVEALAAALGQVFTAEPEPGRVAVAMSGGVDSAVALLRAGPRRDRRDPSALAGSRRPVGGARVLLPGVGRRGPRRRAMPAACRT